MDEIKNFATLKTVVEDIHKRAGELGFDAFSSSDMDDSSSWRFTGHLANLEYFYEEKAGLNCGTENCWAVNANVSKEDQQATIDFMVWLVTDAEASKTMVEQLGIMPYKSAAESTNGFLKNAAAYDADGCYVMDWATNYQPNVDEYRKDLVSALNAYNADQSDAKWEGVKTAFVDGWAKQYKAIAQ